MGPSCLPSGTKADIESDNSGIQSNLLETLVFLKSKLRTIIQCVSNPRNKSGTFGNFYKASVTRRELTQLLNESFLIYFDVIKARTQNIELLVT